MLLVEEQVGWGPRLPLMKCEDDNRRPVKVRCNEGMEMVSQMDIQEVTGFVSYLQCEEKCKEA